MQAAREHAKEEYSRLTPERRKHMAASGKPIKEKESSPQPPQCSLQPPAAASTKNQNGLRGIQTGLPYTGSPANGRASKEKQSFPAGGQAASTTNQKREASRESGSSLQSPQATSTTNLKSQMSPESGITSELLHQQFVIPERAAATLKVMTYLEDDVDKDMTELHVCSCDGFQVGDIVWMGSERYSEKNYIAGIGTICLSLLYPLVFPYIAGTYVKRVQALATLPQARKAMMIREPSEQQPSLLKQPNCSIKPLVEPGELVEYWSVANLLWVQGTLEISFPSGKDFSVECLFQAEYNIRIGKQLRKNVPVDCFRSQFNQADLVDVFVQKNGGQWLEGFINGVPSWDATQTGHDVCVEVEENPDAQVQTLYQVGPDRIRRRYAAGCPIEVYRGPLNGWTPAVVHCLAPVASVVKTQRVSPNCHSCKVTMVWTDHADGDYADGWLCDNVSRCGSGGGPSLKRWHCFRCSSDICHICKLPPRPQASDVPPPLNEQQSPNGSQSVLHPWTYILIFVETPGLEGEVVAEAKPEWVPSYFIRQQSIRQRVCVNGRWQLAF